MNASNQQKNLINYLITNIYCLQKYGEKRIIIEFLAPNWMLNHLLASVKMAAQERKVHISVLNEEFDIQYSFIFFIFAEYRLYYLLRRIYMDDGLRYETHITRIQTK